MIYFYNDDGSFDNYVTAINLEEYYKKDAATNGSYSEYFWLIPIGDLHSEALLVENNQDIKDDIYNPNYDLQEIHDKLAEIDHNIHEFPLSDDLKFELTRKALTTNLVLDDDVNAVHEKVKDYPYLNEAMDQIKQGNANDSIFSNVELNLDLIKNDSKNKLFAQCDRKGGSIEEYEDQVIDDYSSFCILGNNLEEINMHPLNNTTLPDDDDEPWLHIENMKVGDTSDILMNLYTGANQVIDSGIENRNANKIKSKIEQYHPEVEEQYNNKNQKKEKMKVL